MKKIYQEVRFNDFREIINSSAEKYGAKPAFQVRLPNGKIKEYTYSALKESYYRLCSFLIHAGLKNQHIAVVGKNCYEWTLAYLCAATVGVAVPIDKELSADDIENFLTDANCKAVCTDGQIQLKTREDMLVLEFPSVRAIASGAFYHVGGFTGADFPIDAATVDAISFGRDEMRVLIFTSGTTGHSKGVCLSQYNICSDIFSTVSIVKVESKDHTLSVLPLHHTYECTLDCLLLLSKGACISYATSLTKLSSDIVATRPSILVVVPELLRHLSKRIKKSVADGCPAKYKPLFEKLSFGEAMAKLPTFMRLIIRQKVRKQLGGRLRLFIVGAAELDPSIVYDFLALGIRTLQGYGLTECAPLLAGNNDFYYNAASTGVAIPGVRLKIDKPNADGIGEILAKGDNIMLGYFNDEAATKAVFRDGWFCTGDLGRLGPDGELYITGRCKNVIVTDNGKNVYPEELEARISSYPEVGEVLVISTSVRNRVCVKAKILPNLDFLKELLGRLPTADEVKAAVQKVVGSVNSKIPSYKHITVIEVLNEALHKTTTRKVKRCGDNLK